MTSLLVDNFGGESPRVDARLLPDNGAQIASNCDLRSGKIVPDRGHSVDTAGVSSSAKTIFYGDIANAGDAWRTWDNLTYYFKSPFAKEQKGRFYSLQFENVNTTNPMQYEGESIALTDLTFPAPTITPVASSIDRNDPDNTATEVITIGAVDEIEEEAVGTTVSASFDTVYVVGSANPSNNIVNGNTTEFDYTISKYSSTDNGATYTFDTSSQNTYHGSVGYAGKDTHVFNPPINASHTSSGKTNVKVTITASGESITTQATGSALSPSGEILDRYYVYTYVYEDGEESPPSEVSNLATIYKGDIAELTDIGVEYEASGIVTKRIYTTSGTSMKVVGEIPRDIGGSFSTVFTDNVATTALYGELLVANNPPDMHGMVLSPLGFTVGWKERDIYFANEYLPYAWDDQYNITVQYNIIGMITVNDIIYVLTEGQPYILSGFTISSMSLEEIPEPQSCVSRTGITRHKNSAFYISPDGIVQLSGGNSDLFTRKLFDKDTWKSLSPETGALNVHDDMLHFTTDTDHYRFSLADTPIVTQGDVNTNVLYENLKRDALFYADGTNIYEYQGGVTTLSATWKSKEFDLKSEQVISVGRVIADSYNDLTFKVYADGALVSTTAVLSCKPFRLGGSGRASKWSMEITGTDTVSSMEIATSMVRLT